MYMIHDFISLYTSTLDFNNIFCGFVEIMLFTTKLAKSNIHCRNIVIK